MMRSLYSGVSGLKNHQTRMDVIGNNISNVNTVGFKSSRVVFQDIYSQTSKYASAAQANVGGTNPIQIGLGVKLAAIDVLHTSSATQRTDNPTDLMIEGDGFFVVQNADGTKAYTRAGNLYVDNLGNLVNAAGLFVLGISGKTIPEEQATVTMKVITNPTSDPIVVEELECKIFTDPSNGDRKVYETGGKYYTADGKECNLTDDEKDALKKVMTTWQTPDYPTNGQIAESELGLLNLSGFTGISIDENGVIRGLDEAGEEQIIAYMSIATFTNSAGLEKIGNSLYIQSANSGTARYSISQTNGAGKINPGGLEMSNVDLAEEFTDMIITQRGFQANSRVITTSDSLLEELVNLKR